MEKDQNKEKDIGFNYNIFSDVDIENNISEPLIDRAQVDLFVNHNINFLAKFIIITAVCICLGFGISIAIIKLS